MFFRSTGIIMGATNVDDTGRLSRIPNPSEFFHPGFRFKKIPDPGSESASTSFSFFNPKNCSQALGIMIRDEHPRSGT